MVKRAKKRGYKKKKSNYAGAHLNDAITDAFSGSASRTDQQLFFEDKEKQVEPRRVSARKRRLLEEEKEAKEKLEADKKLAVQKKLVEKILKRKNKEKNEAGKSSKKQKTQRNLDIWDDNLDEEEAKKKSKRTRQAKHVYSQKSTEHKIDAVKVAHPAASYNPSVDDLKEGLKAAVENELEYQKRQVRLKTIVAAEKAKLLPDMPSDAESESESESDESDEEDDRYEKIKEQRKLIPRDAKNNEAPNLGKRQPKRLPGERLTKAQRNKEKRKRLQEIEMKNKRRRKAQLAQYKKVDEIEKKVIEKEKLTEKKQERRKQMYEKRLEQEPEIRSSLGKVVYKAPVPDTILPSDLRGSLREIKPHGGFASARLTSIHKRNLVEHPDHDAFVRSRRKKAVKDVMVGQKFIEEKHEQGQKKKRKRFMRGGRVDISV